MKKYSFDFHVIQYLEDDAEKGTPFRTIPILFDDHEQAAAACLLAILPGKWFVRTITADAEGEGTEEEARKGARDDLAFHLALGLELPKGDDGNLDIADPDQVTLHNDNGTLQ